MTTDALPALWDEATMRQLEPEEAARRMIQKIDPNLTVYLTHQPPRSKPAGIVDLYDCKYIQAVAELLGGIIASDENLAFSSMIIGNRVTDILCLQIATMVQQGSYKDLQSKNDELGLVGIAVKGFWGRGDWLTPSTRHHTVALAKGLLAFLSNYNW